MQSQHLIQKCMNTVVAIVQTCSGFLEDLVHCICLTLWCLFLIRRCLWLRQGKLRPDALTRHLMMKAVTHTPQMDRISQTRQFLHLFMLHRQAPQRTEGGSTNARLVQAALTDAHRRTPRAPPATRVRAPVVGGPPSPCEAAVPTCPYVAVRICACDCSPPALLNAPLLTP